MCAGERTHQCLLLDIHVRFLFLQETNGLAALCLSSSEFVSSRRLWTSSGRHTSAGHPPRRKHTVRRVWKGRRRVFKGLKILLSFSFYTNGHSILDTAPAREGHLKSLDCIRFFSMLWVVEGHTAMFFLSNGIIIQKTSRILFLDVMLPILNITKPIMADTIGDAVLSVDTFFTLSGLLVSYLFFKVSASPSNTYRVQQMAKNRKLVKNPVTWVLFYVHRYLR